MERVILKKMKLYGGSYCPNYIYIRLSKNEWEISREYAPEQKYILDTASVLADIDKCLENRDKHGCYFKVLSIEEV